MIVVWCFGYFFQIYYYHNVKCRREMFDKDIVMLQVTTYTSFHFFQVFSGCLCVYFYLHQNLFKEKKDIFLWKDSIFLFYLHNYGIFFKGNNYCCNTCFLATIWKVLNFLFSVYMPHLQECNILTNGLCCTGSYTICLLSEIYSVNVLMFLFFLFRRDFADVTVDSVLSWMQCFSIDSNII